MIEHIKPRQHNNFIMNENDTTNLNDKDLASRVSSTLNTDC